MSFLCLVEGELQPSKSAWTARSSTEVRLFIKDYTAEIQDGMFPHFLRLILVAKFKMHKNYLQKN